MTAFLDRVVAHALGIAPVVHRRREPIFAPVKRKDSGRRADVAAEDGFPLDESLDAPWPFRRRAVARVRAAADDQRVVPGEFTAPAEQPPSPRGSAGFHDPITMSDANVSSERVSSRGPLSTDPAATFSPEPNANREDVGAKDVVSNVLLHAKETPTKERPSEEEADPEWLGAVTLETAKREWRGKADYLSPSDGAERPNPIAGQSDLRTAKVPTHEVITARRAALSADADDEALEKERYGTRRDSPFPTSASKEDLISSPVVAARTDATVDAPSSRSQDSEEELTINVSIGRIDVASSTPPVQERFVASPPGPSLSDYMELRQKIRGR